MFMYFYTYIGVDNIKRGTTSLDLGFESQTMNFFADYRKFMLQISERLIYQYRLQKKMYRKSSNCASKSGQE